MKTRWKRRGEAAGGSILERVLDIRGIGDREGYLYPKVSDLYDPVGLPDMEAARDRILRALERGEKITVYGDYDCDGTVGTAILIRYLRNLGADIDYYIPNRLVEGYGLNQKAIKTLAERGTDLIVTVDNGISSVDDARTIAELGMDLIITDHHEPQEELPEALAIVDGKREDSTYPYRELCGAAVALKLVQALEEQLKSGYDLEELLEMAMLSVIADIVPLIDENRTLVKLGLKSFNISGFKHRGLRRLYELTGLTELTSGVIGYRLAPAINAAGRLGEVEDVMRFLIDEDTVLAEELFEKNEERSRIERRLTNEVLKIIEREKLYEDDIILVGGDGWHTGVIGIVASRIQEYWNKPVIIVGFDEDGFGRGSCRSIKGFNIFSALESTPEVFESFGGHELAAGFSIKRENLEKLRENLLSYAERVDIRKLFTKEYEYDLEITPNEISLDDVEELSLMEPFGIGNPAPVFKVDSDFISGVRRIGKGGEHFTFNAENVRAVAFNKADEFADNLDAPATFLAKAEINCYNNRKKLQFNVKDIKLCPYNSFHNADTLLENVPDSRYLADELAQFRGADIHNDRSTLVVLYNLIKKSGSFSPEDYTKLTGESELTLALGLRILREAGLLDYEYSGGRIQCRLIPAEDKKDLTATPSYQCMEEVLEILKRKDELQRQDYDL